MGLDEQWEKALGSTEVLRLRLPKLATLKNTETPYIFLAESLVNNGDTVVRSGKIMLHKPAIILPENLPQFEGFEFEEDSGIDEEMLKTFFLVRGVSFPSLKFKNETSRVDVYEGSLQKAIEHFKDNLESSEDVDTGLIVGSSDCWQFSLIIYAGMLMAKSMDSDIKWFEERFKKWQE
jgi:hypothetical protein